MVRRKLPLVGGSGRSHQPERGRLKANSIACLETTTVGAATVARSLPLLHLPSVSLPSYHPPSCIFPPMHVRIALSQFRPTKGEYQDNVARIAAVITQGAQLDPKPDPALSPQTP